MGKSVKIGTYTNESVKRTRLAILKATQCSMNMFHITDSNIYITKKWLDFKVFGNIYWHSKHGLYCGKDLTWLYSQKPLLCHYRHQNECVCSLVHRISLLSPLHSTEEMNVIRTWTLYQHGLILIPARINNHMPNKLWVGITYPFPNYNGATAPLSFGMDK